MNFEKAKCESSICSIESSTARIVVEGRCSRASNAEKEQKRAWCKIKKKTKRKKHSIVFEKTSSKRESIVVDDDDDDEESVFFSTAKMHSFFLLFFLRVFLRPPYQSPVDPASPTRPSRRAWPWRQTKTREKERTRRERKRKNRERCADG